MSDFFELYDIENFNADLFLSAAGIDDLDDEKEENDETFDNTTASETPPTTSNKSEVIEDATAPASSLVNNDGNESVISDSSGYHSLASVEPPEHPEYFEKLQSPIQQNMIQSFDYYKPPNPYQYYYYGNPHYFQQTPMSFASPPSGTSVDNNSKPSSVLAQMLNHTSNQNVQPQEHQQLQTSHQNVVYSSNQAFYPPYSQAPAHYSQAPMQPGQVIHGHAMNSQIRPQYVYHNQMQQPSQNDSYYPQNVQRYPQQYIVHQQQQMPHNFHQMPMQQQPSHVQIYNHPQAYQSPQFPSQIRQILPNSMFENFQVKDPENIKQQFELPPSSSKFTMPAYNKEESRVIRVIQPYKPPVIQVKKEKLKEDQILGEEALLEINREKYQRWHKCIQFIKTYLGHNNDLIKFIVHLLEESEKSNDLIQWKERTSKFEHDRAFEFKNKEEITKLYFEIIGKETKYNSIVSRLTRLCNVRYLDCPIFQKTKQRNTYEIFPTLIPSHDDVPCDVEIVNGLPVETSFT